MLTQNGGTLEAPVDLGNYTDPKHYKLPQPDGARVVYGLVDAQRPDRSTHHVARVHFVPPLQRRIHMRPSSLQVVVDTEGLELEPGESWDARGVRVLAAARIATALLERSRETRPRIIRRCSSRRRPPAGARWYCFGPRVTAQQVLDNLDFIAKNIPGLKYIQIDDGYQPAMGDWLETGAAFGGTSRRC